MFDIVQSLQSLHACQVSHLTYACGCSFHREEGGEVSRVGRDDDEREEPPDAAHNSGRGCLPTVAIMYTRTNRHGWRVIAKLGSDRAL